MSNQDLQRPNAEDSLPLGSDKSCGDHFAVSYYLRCGPHFDVPAYLICTHIATHWCGRDSLKNFIVFGDSYSSRLSGVSETEDDIEDAYESDDDSDDATWVNFLADSQSPAVVVNNFAFPGATVEYDLDGQLARFLSQFSEIDPKETTFVFFLGINDCGGIPGEDLPSLVNALFNAVQRLYASMNARNFILIDVPPTDLSPAGKSAGDTFDLASRIKEWNTSLVSRAFEIALRNNEVTMLVFSSHRVLSEILDNPCAHGFAEGAKDVVGRGIWRDGLHLTREVHKIIANRMLGALGF